MNSTPDGHDVSGAPWVTTSGREAQDDDLRASITALGTLATGRLDLEDFLASVASLSVSAIPGADGAGCTLSEDNRSDTVVTMTPFVREVDDIQYDLGQGPCISAAAEAKTMRSGSLGGDARWPKFGSKVARLGVHSAVSLPLITPTGVVGCLNVYAHAKHAFDDRAAELGAQFAIPAAIAVQTAQVLAQARRVAIQLQTALDTRGVIDRAIGIMMSRNGGTEEQAMTRLRLLSQHEHHKLATVAQSIVDEAVRRARARRADS